MLGSNVLAYTSQSACINLTDSEVSIFYSYTLDLSSTVSHNVSTMHNRNDAMLRKLFCVSLYVLPQYVLILKCIRFLFIFSSLRHPSSHHALASRIIIQPYHE